MAFKLEWLKNNQLARNTMWAFSGQGVRTIVLAGYFIVIARLLRPEGYGSFVSVLALASILSPFSSLGSGNLLVKHVSRNPDSFPLHWGNALLAVAVSAPILIAAVVLLSLVVLPATIPFSLLIYIALAELFFARIHEICGQAFQAFQRLDRSALILLSLNVCRLITAAALSVVGKDFTASQWGAWYLFSTAVSTGFCVFLVHRELGKPLIRLAKAFAEVKEGFFFSVSQSAQGIYNDIDKSMLAKLSTLDAAGIYSAAYRIIDVSFTPVRSLLYASYARFFQQGESGIHGSFKFAMKLIPVACGFSAVICIVLNVVAPVVPYLLGAEYASAVSAIRILSVIPLIRSIHYFVADTLTGAGLQGKRSAVQFTVAVFNVAINFVLIPMYAWRGAAFASLASDSLLAVLLLMVVAYDLAKAKRKVQYA